MHRRIGGHGERSVVGVLSRCELSWWWSVDTAAYRRAVWSRTGCAASHRLVRSKLTTNCPGSLSGASTRGRRHGDLWLGDIAWVWVSKLLGPVAYIALFECWYDSSLLSPQNSPTSLEMETAHILDCARNALDSQCL